MMGHSATLLIAPATIAGASNRDVTEFDHSQLAVGQKFEIQTADRAYRGHIVDRATGECRMAVSADGTNFSTPRTTYLLGATAGPQARQMLVLMHEVKVGMKMELGQGDLEPKNREITSEVKAIKLVR
jgi:hypothetical protein